MLPILRIVNLSLQESASLVIDECLLFIGKKHAYQRITVRIVLVSVKNYILI